MNPRRLVEQFEDGKWTREPTQDGWTYLVSAKVNGVQEEFKIAVPVPRMVRKPASATPGDAPTDAHWEAAAKVKIMRAVAGGCLDNWPAAEPRLLSGIDWNEIEDLFAEAKRKGLI